VTSIHARLQESSPSDQLVLGGSAGGGLGYRSRADRVDRGERAESLLDRLGDGQALSGSRGCWPAIAVKPARTSAIRRAMTPSTAMSWKEIFQ
jgi:hypothetical protein